MTLISQPYFYKTSSLANLAIKRLLPTFSKLISMFFVLKWKPVDVQEQIQKNMIAIANDLNTFNFIFLIIPLFLCKKTNNKNKH